MPPSQMSLFQPATPPLPEGLGYRADFLTDEEQEGLVAKLADTPFKAFEFHGFEGKRRTHSYGLRYVFDGSGLQEAERMPEWLLPARDRAAQWVKVAPDSTRHAVLTEYAPGAGIGWHRDRSVFGDVVGLSLLAPARLRFRRRAGTKWGRSALIVEPGSAYLLRGEARSDWEHSIAPMETLRYSITFRTLRG